MSKKIIFFFLIIFPFIKTTHLREGDSISLVRVDYGFNSSYYNLSLLNEDAEILYLKSSRIAYIKNFSDSDEIFDLYSKFINRYWIFLVTSPTVADQLLLKNDYDDSDLEFHGLLLPKSLNYKLPKKNKNKDVPVFSFNDNYTENLVSLDIRNITTNTYFLYEIYRKISSYPVTYFIINSSFTIALGIILIVGWKYLLGLSSRRNILVIHKFLTCLPFFIVMVGITLLIKAFSVENEDPYQEYESSIYINTVLIILNAIYRTFLWFLILLVCYGYKISLHKLEAKDLKFFMKMFFVIYISMCADQILDSLTSIEGVFLNFQLSEIKNIIYHSFMLWLFLKRITITTNFLKRKLIYAMEISPEFVDGLIFKLKLMRQVKKMVLTFLPSFFAVLLIHKIILRPYDTQELQLYNYHIIDLVINVYFMWIFMPKTLPNNFDVDFGNDLEGDLGMIYKYRLCGVDDFWKGNYYKGPSKKEVTEYLNKNRIIRENESGESIPIVIVEPTFGNNNRNYENGDGENNSEINRYINAIKIGYSF